MANNNYPTSLYDAVCILDGRKTRKIAHNTWLNDYRIGKGNGSIAVKYHNTDVVQWYSDGTVKLRHNGWKTPTTKKRFNECGFSVWQVDSEWFITTQRGTFSFEDDSIMIDAAGHVSTGLAIVSSLLPIGPEYRTSNARKIVVREED